MGELAVAIGMAGALQGLAVGPPAVAQFLPQQLADRVRADRVAHRIQCVRELGVALGDPQQRSHRIAKRCRLDQAAQIRQERRILLLHGLATADNRPGASGVTAAQSVARAAPDGYTLLFGHTAEMAIAQSLVKDLGYDPQKDFKPVALGAVFPLALVVKSSAAYSTIANMLAQSRSSRRPLLFASSGTGTPGHFAGELLRLRTNSRLTHVPYYGGGPALNAVLDGRVDFSPISQAEPR